MSSRGLNQWRNYFREADSDIFDVIENGIMVAAMDFPKEFALRRDRLAERLYTCRLRLSHGFDGASPRANEEQGSKSASEREGCEIDGGSKGNTNSSGEDAVVDANTTSNYSCGEAEALTDEIDAETQFTGEVFRIKEILLNMEDESISCILDSLRRLQLMNLGVEILKETEIGKAVNGLRKHGSKNIRGFARTLICGWKDMVDEWVKSSQATNDGSSESVNPPPEDEEDGLPSPPLDESVFFTTQPMELSGFFDGLDDDGNMFTGEAVEKENKKQEQFIDNTQKTPIKRADPNISSAGRKVRRGGETIAVPNQPSSSAGSAPTRPTKPTMGPKGGGYNDEDAVRIKLEATKKKLHERYQQAENAKRQRTIQVMELHDIPKKSGHRNPPAKIVTQNRRSSLNTRR